MDISEKVGNYLNEREGQVEKDTPEFQKFMVGVEKISHDNAAKNITKPEFKAKFNKKYIRIERKDSKNSGSVHAFVDRQTGDVYKPASWKTPAKHARGNIFDNKNGLGFMGPYGPGYLK